jgi:hypothetical protein
LGTIGLIIGVFIIIENAKANNIMEGEKKENDSRSESEVE